MMGYHDHFHVRLPKVGATQFLWNSPLFSAEGKNLTLHLGLPEGLSDDEAIVRYRKMRFGGLSKIYLHCARSAGENLLQTVYGSYAHQKLPPIVMSIASS